MKGGEFLNFEKYVSGLDSVLRPDESFDIIRREYSPKHGRCVFWCIDGLIDSDIMERIIEFIHQTKQPSELLYTLPNVEVSESNDPYDAAIKVLSGMTALAVEGVDSLLLVNARNYPARSMQEPENERVLRGPRDGFEERLIPNTALIRRRVRDPRLTFERYGLGRMTNTDVAIAYIKGKADEKFLAAIRKKLSEFPANTLSFGEQTIAEYLVNSRWYNPFPKVRYTERPDCAAAMLLEGSIVIVCDNTPSVIILPTSIFDFLQEANDFYLPPVTATYLRTVRLAISVLTLVFLPLWYLLMKNPQFAPQWMEFVILKEEGSIPLFAQLLIVEFIIDGLKIASLNTPNALGNSLSVVMGLILGEMAVNAGWFISEVILYMAFIAIGNFAQPSFELGYALKLMRILLLTLTAAFNVWGFVIGLVIIFLLIVSNKTLDGSRSYLYPLIPWNGHSMKRFFVRQRLKYPPPGKSKRK